jgi:hypothetical protein
MNATTACPYIITLSLVSIGVPTPIPATAASGSGAQASAPTETHEATKPETPGTANRDGTMRGTAPAGMTKQAPMPSNRAQEVEERVRSGQMEQPIAQGEISERLNQLESGASTLSDETASKHSNR